MPHPVIQHRAWHGVGAHVFFWWRRCHSKQPSRISSWQQWGSSHTIREHSGHMSPYHTSPSRLGLCEIQRATRGPSSPHCLGDGIGWQWGCSDGSLSTEVAWAVLVCLSFTHLTNCMTSGKSISLCSLFLEWETCKRTSQSFYSPPLFHRW